MSNTTFYSQAATTVDDIKTIPLGGKYSNGAVVIVDAEDYDKLSKIKWRLVNQGNTQYAVSGKRVNRKVKRIFMHRVIMNTPKGFCTDHVNHNGLDNRKKNLRICTNSQNQMNKIKNNQCALKYKGVWKSKYNKWIANLELNGKGIYLGTFNTEVEAALAYNTGALRYFGEFAFLNKVYCSPLVIKNNILPITKF